MNICKRNVGLLWGLLFPIGMLQAAEPTVTLPLREIAEKIHAHHLNRPPLESVLDQITQNDPSPRPEKVVNHYLQTLDPYSRYITAAEVSRQETDRDLQYVIGVELLKHAHGILLIPYQGGPLDKSGVPEPKYLVSIDSRSVFGRPLTDIISWLKTSGKTVQLELADEPRGAGIKINVVKARFIPSSVEVIRHKTANIIRIREFVAHETTAFLSAAVARLSNSALPFVIDLRYCTGGDLYEAIDAASLFLGHGEIVTRTIDATGRIEVYRSPNQTPLYREILPIFTGPDTASAAEVFAAALQHYLRAVLIGEETYGKNLSQGVYKLRDSSILTLTNLRIIRAGDDNRIEKKELVPEIPIENVTLRSTDSLIRVANESIRKGINLICLEPSFKTELNPAIVAKEIQLSMLPEKHHMKLIKKDWVAAGNRQLSICVGPIFGHDRAATVLKEYVNKLAPLAFSLHPIR